MADTDTETLPNGTGLIEEDERMKQRPADIDADVREMERRKRVEALMSSKLFREELERVLDQQMHEDSDAPLLQRIRQMVGGRLHTGSMRGPSCVLPINDIRGIEGIGYEKGEKILRCKLAAVYRLVDLFGWTQTGITGQITARLNTAVEQVLTTPRGLLPHEVTASSLVKVDMQGVVQDQGTTNFPVNVEGFSLHASVHAARPDVRCVLHVRSPSALAVSSMKRGLLPLCDEAALLGDIAYHRVPYGTLDNEECEKLVRALGPHAKVLMLACGGALCCGATLEEAFHQARHLTAACDVQLRLAALPLDQLSLLDDDYRRQIYENSRKPPAEGGKWRVGGEEFEALMRMLDNAGFRTGYIYRHPLIKNDVPRPKNDVEVPPAVSSLGYLLEEEELYRQGLWKKGQGKTGERTRWLNSPNVYQKVEVLETGTTDPKKITKWVDANNEEWVQDGSPAHNSTPVKIDTLQFVPKNTNPKEFKQLQQQIKDYRRADKISAGPQSHILEGVSWDEASKMVGEDAANTHTGDHVVLMGAASKGIIQRGYQHNATMYSAPYARNPFDHVTDTDIAEYRRTVERKQRSDYDTDLSESEAISAAQITSPASAPSETEEESRDEHRVLRIETKQAPIRSQPEVVLSDVDTTDFLHAERSHADRTKDKARDPYLLPDDEVFLDPPTVTSSVTSPAQAVTREHQAAVQQTVVRGNLTLEGIARTEALSTNKRTLHDYSRTTTFDSVIKKFDSPKNCDVFDKKSHPKCKVSLHARLSTHDVKLDAVEVYNPGINSSRSSLYSIPSIEWDGKCRSEYVFRTRSLPRQRVRNSNNLYRTQSHSGFINSNIKDPEPKHFHIPRCRSCGTTYASYAWELNKEEKKMRRVPASVYLSMDNIPQKCVDEIEANVVKVTENEVPVFKLAKVDTEFVDSQEFNEDIYLGELGTSFSSDNQTVIEKPLTQDDLDVTITEKTVEVDTVEAKPEEKKDIFRAELVAITNDEDEMHTTMSTEGEYHSFTDDMYFDESTYESPVKDLVEKDIRDYSVPIDIYCEDYEKKDGSPGKSPQKRRENAKGNVLEPILEESKSSSGDDSVNDKFVEFQNKSVEDSVVQAIEVSIRDIGQDKSEDKIEEDKCSIPVDEGKETFLGGFIEESCNKALIEGSIKDVKDKSEDETAKIKSSIVEGKKTFLDIDEMGIINCEKDTTDVEAEFLQCDKESYIAEEGIATTVIVSVPNNDIHMATDVYCELEAPQANEKELNCAFQNVIEMLNTEAVPTGESTVEISSDPRSSDIISMASSGFELRSFDSTAEFEKYEIIADVVATLLEKIDFVDMHSNLFLNLPKERIGSHFDLGIQTIDKNEVVDEKFDTITEVISQLETDTDYDTQPDSVEDFSIAKIIQEMEIVNLNETVLTENSDTETQSQRVVEAVVYYIFDRAFVYLAEKAKTYKQKPFKKVVTVVDSEDILFTAMNLWPANNSEQIEFETQENFEIDKSFEENKGDNSDSAILHCVEVETCLKDEDEKENVASLNQLVHESSSDFNIIKDVKYNIAYSESVENCDIEEQLSHDNNIAIGTTREGDFSQSEEETIGLPQDSFFNPDQELDVSQESTNSGDTKSESQIFHSDIYCEIGENESFINLSTKYISLGNFTMAEPEENSFDTKTYTKSEISIEVENEDFNASICDYTYDTAAETISDKLEQSLIVENDTFCNLNKENNENYLNNTYKVDRANTAFVEDYSRSSSPITGAIFDVCTESPINNPNDTFIGEDLSVLYEKDDTILGSPFVKRAPVISMSQTIHSGGMKYWISFDESLTEENKRSCRPLRKPQESKIASFVTVNLRERNYSHCDSLEKDHIKRSSILLEDFKADKNDSFAPATEYNTYEELNSSESEPQKKLLYDSRIDVHTKASKRQYSSWPPFEDTLLYRIISHFRMSESFDDKDFEAIQIDDNL